MAEIAQSAKIDENSIFAENAKISKIAEVSDIAQIAEIVKIDTNIASIFTNSKKAKIGMFARIAEIA